MSMGHKIPLDRDLIHQAFGTNWPKKQTWATQTTKFPDFPKNMPDAEK